MSRQSSIVRSTEQQDGLEACNIICDILDKVTYVSLHLNNLYSSYINENPVGLMYTDSPWVRCIQASVYDPEYRGTYITYQFKIHFKSEASSQDDNSVSRSNKNLLHNCHNNFNTTSKILVLVVKRKHKSSKTYYLFDGQQSLVLTEMLIPMITIEYNIRWLQFDNQAC